MPWWPTLKKRASPQRLLRIILACRNTGRSGKQENQCLKESSFCMKAPCFKALYRRQASGTFCEIAAKTQRFFSLFFALAPHPKAAAQIKRTFVFWLIYATPGVDPAEYRGQTMAAPLAGRQVCLSRAKPPRISRPKNKKKEKQSKVPG